MRRTEQLSTTVTVADLLRLCNEHLVGVDDALVEIGHSPRSPRSQTLLFVWDDGKPAGG